MKSNVLPKIKQPDPKTRAKILIEKGTHNSSSSIDQKRPDTRTGSKLLMGKGMNRSDSSIDITTKNIMSYLENSIKGRGDSKTFQFSRDISFPLKSQTISESKCLKNVEVLCTLSEGNNKMVVKISPAFTNNDENFIVTTEINLTEYGFIHYNDHNDEIHKAQISNILDQCEVKLDENGDYKVITNNFISGESLLNHTNDKREVTVHRNKSQEPEKLIDLFQSNVDINNDKLSLNLDSQLSYRTAEDEKIVYTTERPIIVHFIPTIVIVANRTWHHLKTEFIHKTSTETPQTKANLFLKNIDHSITESLDAVIIIQSTIEDTTDIKVKFNKPSHLCKSPKTPAICTDQEIVVTVKTPSMVLVDDVLHHDYFVSLANGIKVEYKADSNYPIIAL